jgi:Family of unknown function (DUF6516)
MNAEPIAKAKEIRDDGSIVEIVIWRLTQPVAPCTHLYKYRLYFGAAGHCRVRYDTKRLNVVMGDHLYVNNIEEPYRFVSITRLMDDFQHDVETWS